VTARRVLVVALGIAAIAVYGWVDVRQRARLDRGLKAHHTDVTVYTAAAAALSRGEDPYRAESPRGWRYVYPPLTAILLMPIATWRSDLAAYLLYFVSVAALAVALWAVARAIGPPSGSSAAGFACFLCAPFLVQTLQRGQVTILLLATQAVATLWLLRGRDVAAGVVLALGVALRLTPLLPAGMVVVACLHRLVSGDRRRALAFPAGLAIGLVLFFGAVPAAALGVERAREVTERWIETTREVYGRPGDLADFSEGYRIQEWTFKNQGVRRVAGTVAAGVTGAGTERDGTPRIDLRPVDAFAFGTAAVVALGAVALAWVAMGARDARMRRALAVGGVLPLLVTRYAWPVHFVAMLPFLAETLAGPGRGRLSAALVFAAGAAAFYAGHGEALRALPAHGCLLLATVAALALAVPAFARRGGGIGAPAVAWSPAAIAARFPDGSPLRRLYRRLRLERAGYDAIEALVPARGTVLDLGCGEGLLAHVLAEGGRSVVAIDHDAARVERARASVGGRSLRFVAADFTETSLPRADAVLLVDVLHYLQPAAQDALLARAVAALEPGGTLLLRDPAAGSGLRFLWSRVHERVATGLGLTRARLGCWRTADAWAAALSSAGLREVRALPPAVGTPHADRIVVGRSPR
jgi:2-polyprenyl-3-methyl-5-hydroxy-6-metoxy-1,4-benzoquinol methylase